MKDLPAGDRRTIGGREVRPIGLGCMNIAWAYGTPPSSAEAAHLLDRAIDCGYEHLDTARIYGLGKSERLIGDTLHGRRKHFFLASKCGIFTENGERRIDCRPETIRSALEESLRLLRTDHIDLYYLHRFDAKVPIEESVGALAQLVAEGKIGGIGLSEMSAQTLRRAHAVHPITAIQTEYSLWTRDVEIAVMEACRELGVALVAFSPLCRGPLVGSSPDPSHFEEKDLRRMMPRFDADNWARNRMLAQELASLAGEAGVTPAQLALAWVLSRGRHVHAIPGTGNVAHMEENLATLDCDIDEALIAKAGKLVSPKTTSGPRYSEIMRQGIDTEEYA